MHKTIEQKSKKTTEQKTGINTFLIRKMVRKKGT